MGFLKGLGGLFGIGPDPDALLAEHRILSRELAALGSDEGPSASLKYRINALEAEMAECHAYWCGK